VGSKLISTSAVLRFLSHNSINTYTHLITFTHAIHSRTSNTTVTQNNDPRYPEHKRLPGAAPFIGRGGDVLASVLPGTLVSDICAELGESSAVLVMAELRDWALEFELGKGTVLLPTTISEVPRLTIVPDMVISEPGKRVVPAMEKPVGLGVKVWPAIVKADLLSTSRDGLGNGIVLVPMTRPEGPKLIGVPSTVTADPPGETDFPPIEKPVGFAVKIRPASVNTDPSA